MTEKYTIPLDSDGNLSTQVILRVSDNAYIPIDLANSDYQAYLNPVEHLTEIPTV